MKTLVLSSLLVLGFSSAALAQTPSSFVDVDSDASGELSFVELQVAWPDLTQSEFDTADVDLSGGLTTDELNSLQPSAIPGAPSAPTEAAPAEPEEVGTPESIAD